MCTVSCLINVIVFIPAGKQKQLYYHFGHVRNNSTALNVMHEIKLLLTNLDHTSFTSSEKKIANNTKYRKAICIFLRSVELLLSFTSTDLLQIVTIREEK